MPGRNRSPHDVLIVGGGPAGLSAALVLGRCRRRVLVCDAGHPRNAESRGLHGYLTRDGIPPGKLLQIGRAQLKRYGVEWRAAAVTDAHPTVRGFEVRLKNGGIVQARKLLLATGVTDQLPPLTGLPALYGRSVFHCPYCDGWEVRDQPLAVYGQGAAAAGLAVSLLTWSADVVVCTDGPTRFAAADAARLARHHVACRTERMAALEHTAGPLLRIRFRSGDVLRRRALFLSTGHRQRCALADRLGCSFTNKGAVQTNRLMGTNIPGVYVAGDAARDVHLVIEAAAEGAKAAFAINRALEAEDRA